MKKSFLIILVSISYYVALSQSSFFEKGLQAFNNEEFEDAILFYSKVIERNHSTNAYFNRALSHYQLGNFTETIEDLSIVLDKDPEDSQAWYHRGLAYYDIEEYKKAFYDSKKAVNINPQYGKAYSTIGLCYFKWQKYQEAVENLDIALGLNKNANIFYNRALVYQELEDYLQAEKDFTSAINLEEKVDYYWGRANLFYKNTDYKMSIEDYSAAIEIDSTISALYYNRALSYYSDYQNNNALIDFKKVINLDKNDIDANWYIVLCNYELENYEEALKFYYKVERLDENYEFLSQIDKQELENKTKLGNNFWYIITLIFLAILALVLFSKMFVKNEAPYRKTSY